MSTDSTTWEQAVAPPVHAPESWVLTIVGHPELARIGETCPLLGPGPWSLSRKEPYFCGPEGSDAGQSLNDRYLSRSPFELQLHGQGLRLRRASCKALLAVNGQPLGQSLELDLDQLKTGLVLNLGERVCLLLRRQQLIPFQPRPPACGTIGNSPELHRLRQQLELAASRPDPALLMGESGSGKELAARALHELGPQAEGPFVATNLATLPPSMAAAELFGHRQGAFTGANQHRKGLFERAHGGTLFLDEVGEASSDVQAMLLRVIEEGCYLPIGAEQPVQSQAKVVAATDLNLSSAMEEGTFKAPLFHRLAALPINIPPLRNRREDVGTITAAQLQQEGSSQAPDWLSAARMATLVQANWPGNVRQLLNTIKQLQNSLDEAERDAVIEALSSAVAPSIFAEPKPTAELSQEALADALEAHDFRVSATARALGLSRATLYRRMRAAPGLRPAKDLSEEELRQQFVQQGQDLSEMARALKVSKTGLSMRLRAIGLIS